MSVNYKTVPNQKVIRTGKKTVCDKNNTYFVLNKQAMFAASQNLETKAGFTLYMYFASNQEGYEFALSRTDVLNTLGVKIDAYKNAINELIKKGYLVETSSNHYTFYDMPNQEKETVVVSDNHTWLCKTTTRGGLGQPEILQKNTYNNTYTGGGNPPPSETNQQLEELPTIPQYMLSSLCEPYTDCGDGTVILSNGKHFRILKGEKV